MKIKAGSVKEAMKAGGVLDLKEFEKGTLFWIKVKIKVRKIYLHIFLLK